MSQLKNFSFSAVLFLDQQVEYLQADHCGNKFLRNVRNFLPFDVAPSSRRLLSSTCNNFSSCRELSHINGCHCPFFLCLWAPVCRILCCRHNDIDFSISMQLLLSWKMKQWSIYFRNFCSNRLNTKIILNHVCIYIYIYIHFVLRSKHTPSWKTHKQIVRFPSNTNS
jgi:hypothetical protein